MPPAIVLIQSGDRVAAHDMYGLPGPDELLSCHVDPRPRMKQHKDIAPLKCPHCLKLVTPELQEKEAADFAALSPSKQVEWMKEHSKNHGGQTGSARVGQTGSARVR